MMRSRDAVSFTRGELVSAALAGRLDRRDLVRRATALGMSASVIAGLTSLNSSRRAAAQSGPVTMVGWGYHPEIVEDNVLAFEKESADDVEYQLTTGGNYHQIVETKFLGGEKPSVVYSESEYMYRWWKAGFIQDVEGLTDSDTAFYKENMFPFGVEQLSLPDGKLSGLPYYSGYNAFVYNREHLDKAKLEPPTSWEEMMEQAKKLQADGISEHPFLSAQGHEWASLSWSIFAIWYSEGEPVFDADFNPTFADGGVAFKKVIEMHKQWLDEGITPPDILTQEGESVPAFMTGRHSFMVVHDYDQQGFNTGENSEVKGMIGNAIMPGSAHETFSWTACYLMGAREVDRQRAWNLMQWLGGKAQDGQYHGNKRWALETGLGCPYPEVMEDPEVLAAWSEWRDMDVHVQQLEQSKGRPVEKTMWFPEWNWEMMTQVQEYMQGSQTIDETITNLVAKVDELKALYPE
jgi:multiple sugar transport system substrate-binding protein